MKVEQVKKKYKDEWVLARVLKEDELNRPIDIKVIKHGKNKDKVYSNLMKIEDGAHVTTFYTGDPIRDGPCLISIWLN